MGVTSVVAWPARRCAAHRHTGCMARTSLRCPSPGWCGGPQAGVSPVATPPMPRATMCGGRYHPSTPQEASAASVTGPYSTLVEYAPVGSRPRSNDRLQYVKGHMPHRNHPFAEQLAYRLRCSQYRTAPKTTATISTSGSRTHQLTFNSTMSTR